MTLTPRERMRRFLAHQPIDRIPSGLGGSETAGMHLLAYDNLKRILGVADSRSRMSTFMTTALFEPAVLRAAGSDVILLGTKLCPAQFWGPGARGQWKEQVLWGKPFQVAAAWNFRTDPDGTIWWDDHSKCPPGGIYFDSYGPSDFNADLHAAAAPSPDDYNPPHEFTQEYLRALEESARWLYDNTDFCIACGETIVDLQHKPGGLQHWWMRLVEEPAAAHEFLHKACEAGLSQLRQLEQAVGRYADILLIADDMGDSRGVTIGPDLWRAIYKPHYQRLFGEWHRITSMRASLHCCGSAVDILDDLIECGVDLFNPVQISARGMQPDELVRRFGERVIFYGGAYDAVQTPPATPPEIVYEQVKANITALNRHGRYLFAAVHNVPGDTPESHLRAILAAYESCNAKIHQSAQAA